MKIFYSYFIFNFLIFNFNSFLSIVLFKELLRFMILIFVGLKILIITLTYNITYKIGPL